MLVAAGSAFAQATSASPIHLRIVGGLGGVNQYTRFEEPFWTRSLPAATGGRVTAEIAPFDRVGIRAQEAVRLTQLGVVPFGTVLLSVAGADDPLLAGADLAGLNRDFAALRRTVAAYRPTLARRLRDAHGIELLALYTYPAQVVLCKEPFAHLADLAGRRVRASSASQSDFLMGLGAIPVITTMGEIVPQMRSGGLACAITAATTARSIGLTALTTHVSTMPVNHGLSAFVANAAAWQALSADVRGAIQRGLAGLERDIWAAAERESAEAAGDLLLVPLDAADDGRRSTAFSAEVLPRWLLRCGSECTKTWDTVLAPALGLPAAGR